MSKPEFIAAMHSARASLDTAIAELDEARASSRFDPPWSTKDLITHVAAYDFAVLSAIEQAGRGEKPTWAWQQFADFDAWNAFQTSRRASWDLRAVLAEFHEVRARLLTELHLWPDTNGPFGPETWDLQESPVKFLTNHELEHAEHLRQALRLVHQA